MEVFGITSPEEQQKLNQRLIERVRTLEERAEIKRKRLGRKVMGATRLQAERLNTTHQPDRKGKRMWCLCEDRPLRIQFTLFLKGLFARARAVRARWEVGDYTVPYPMGLYPPSQPKLVEPLSIW
jgi:hypothetical protein